MTEIDDIKLEMDPHPSYSPDLAPSDEFLFQMTEGMEKTTEFLGAVRKFRHCYLFRHSMETLRSPRSSHCFKVIYRSIFFCISNR